MTLKTSNRLPDYLDPMRQAIADAQTFTEGMAPADFMQDRRTQQAVVMSLIVLGDTAQAITALTSYLRLKPKDAGVWSELGGLQLSEARTNATQYQAVQQASQLADPSQPFLPSGTLATAIGSNPAMQRKSVVLPQPDGPSRQAMRPLTIWKPTPATTVCVP